MSTLFALFSSKDGDPWSFPYLEAWCVDLYPLHLALTSFNFFLTASQWGGCLAAGDQNKDVVHCSTFNLLFPLPRFGDDLNRQQLTNAGKPVITPPFVSTTHLWWSPGAILFILQFLYYLLVSFHRGDLQLDQQQSSRQSHLAARLFDRRWSWKAQRVLGWRGFGSGAGSGLRNWNPGPKTYGLWWYVYIYIYMSIDIVNYVDIGSFILYHFISRSTICFTLKNWPCCIHIDGKDPCMEMWKWDIWISASVPGDSSF